MLEKNRKLIQLMLDLKKANEGLKVFFKTTKKDSEQILEVFILEDNKRIKMGYFSWNSDKKNYENSLRKK